MKAKIGTKYYYLLSLLFVFVFPTIIIGYFVLDSIPALNLFTFVLGITILGSVWDIWATKHGRKDPIWLWQFNPHDTLGIKIFDLPIEEYLFYIVSSLYIVFIWEGIKYSLGTGNILMYTIIPFLGVWSLGFISMPYLIRAKNDRL